MTKGQYPSISTGLGNLTPDLWRRMMTMLNSFEQKNRDETSNRNLNKDTKPFLARIDKAKCIGDNRYKYAWTEVYLKDDNTVAVVTNGRTSTGDTDEYDYAAINLLEIANTASRGSVGVNLGSLDYPSGYNLQCLGGGYATGSSEVTPNVLPIVVMNRVGGRSVETVARYVFGNTNENDGSCNFDSVQVTDGVTEPAHESGVAKIFVDTTSGDLKVVFGDDVVKTIVTDS
tara:strand:+ start:5055 stop:5744 length:690 start_codon:yes stop_codon:yes gene_type:complete